MRITRAVFETPGGMVQLDANDAHTRDLFLRDDGYLLALPLGQSHGYGYLVPPARIWTLWPHEREAAR